jgi:hypothetical protein
MGDYSSQHSRLGWEDSGHPDAFDVPSAKVAEYTIYPILVCTLFAPLGIIKAVIVDDNSVTGHPPDSFVVPAVSTYFTLIQVQY